MLPLPKHELENQSHMHAGTVYVFIDSSTSDFLFIAVRFEVQEVVAF